MDTYIPAQISTWKHKSYKKQSNMIPPNVHNSLTTDSQDIKLNDRLVKTFKIILYRNITELQENAEKQLNG